MKPFKEKQADFTIDQGKFALNCQSLKRVLSIALLGILVLPALSTFMWLYHEVEKVHHAVQLQFEKGLPVEDVMTLTLTKNEAKQLDWENESEFEYQNQMYDLVSKKETSDQITFFVWVDSRETFLNNQISKLILKALGSGSESDHTAKIISSIFLSDYFPSEADYTLHLQLNIIESPNTQFRDSLHTQWTLSIPSPPPDLVL